MLQCHNKIFVISSFQDILQCTHENHQDKVSAPNKNRHVSVNHGFIWIKAVATDDISQNECNLQTDQIQNDKIYMLDPLVRIFSIHKY